MAQHLASESRDSRRLPMVNRPLSLLAYGAILLVITTNAFASPKEADPRWLILSVFNDPSVPAEILAHGETRAAHILAQTGIQVEWLNCAAGALMFPTSLNSHHLAAVSATLRISPCGLSRWAIRAGRYFRRSIYRQPRQRNVYQAVLRAPGRAKRSLTTR